MNQEEHRDEREESRAQQRNGNPKRRPPAFSKSVNDGNDKRDQRENKCNQGDHSDCLLVTVDPITAPRRIQTRDSKPSIIAKRVPCRLGNQRQ